VPVPVRLAPAGPTMAPGFGYPGYPGFPGYPTYPSYR